MSITTTRPANPIHRHETAARPGPAGYRLIANDFDTRIVPLDRLDGAPDFVTTFPPGIAGYIAAHDEAIAYLEDVIADSLETLKQLKDARWMNAMELHQTAAR